MKRTRYRALLAFGAGVAATVILGAAQAGAAASSPWFISNNTTLATDYDGQLAIIGQGTRLDCAGHTVGGDGIGVGVNVLADDVTVTNCNVRGFETGILVTGLRATISRDSATGNGQGIALAATTRSTATENHADGNSLWGIIVAPGTSGNTVSNNSANGNRLIGIALNTTSGNLVTQNSANHNGGTGIDVLLSTGNDLADNVAMHNGVGGFSFALSSDNTVNGNAATNNGTPGNGSGFSLNASSTNRFVDNVAIHNGGVGFYAFFQSEQNVFTENRACQSFYVDAADVSTGAGNVWAGNSFCSSELD